MQTLPRRMTPTLETPILTAVAQGAFPDTAAATAGVSPSTLRRYCAQDKNALFRHDLAIAHARCRLAAEKATYANNPEHWLQLTPLPQDASPQLRPDRRPAPLVGLPADPPSA